MGMYVNNVEKRLKKLLYHTCDKIIVQAAKINKYKNKNGKKIKWKIWHEKDKKKKDNKRID